MISTLISIWYDCKWARSNRFNCCWLSHNKTVHFLVSSIVGWIRIQKCEWNQSAHSPNNWRYTDCVSSCKRLLHTNWLKVDFYIPKTKNQKQIYYSILVCADFTMILCRYFIKRTKCKCIPILSLHIFPLIYLILSLFFFVFSFILAIFCLFFSFFLVVFFFLAISIDCCNIISDWVKNFIDLTCGYFEKQLHGWRECNL